jgi:hypothetical protein
VEAVIRVLAQQLVREEGDQYDNAYLVNLVIKVPAGWDRNRVNAYAAAMYNTRCHHTYDCCGHFYGFVYRRRTVHLKRREWFIQICQSRNV